MIDQNALRNLLSRYKIMDYEIPMCTHSHSNKGLVATFAVILFLQAPRMSILENLLMTKKT